MLLDIILTSIFGIAVSYTYVFIENITDHE
ncbi:MAG: hypothetical protein CG442_1123 [Methylococcaceae bacterium NSO1]|nr:MAG: hypothetical protein CG442_1123 [Methylococcaceae bacterium NSO1]